MSTLTINANTTGTRAQQNHTHPIIRLARKITSVFTGKARAQKAPEATPAQLQKRLTRPANPRAAVVELVAQFRDEDAEFSGGQGPFRTPASETDLENPDADMNPILLTARIKGLIGDNPAIFLNPNQAEQDKFLTLFTPMLFAFMSRPFDEESFNKHDVEAENNLGPAHIQRVLEKLSLACGGGGLARLIQARTHGAPIPEDQLVSTATIATAIGGSYNTETGQLEFTQERLEQISQALRAYKADRSAVVRANKEELLALQIPKLEKQIHALTALIHVQGESTPLRQELAQLQGNLTQLQDELDLARLRAAAAIPLPIGSFIPADTDNSTAKPVGAAPAVETAKPVAKTAQPKETKVMVITGPGRASQIRRVAKFALTALVLSVIAKVAKRTRLPIITLLAGAAAAKLVGPNQALLNKLKALVLRAISR